MTKVLINAIHSKTGGGLVYLNNVLPYLAKDKKLDITVLCHKNYADRLDIPDNINVHQVNFRGGFFITLLWEQLVLPFMARQLQAEVTLCNSGFIPFFAPNPVPIIHSTAHMVFLEKKFLLKLYWLALIIITKLSIFRARKVCSVARNIIPLYGKGIPKQLYENKLYIAPAACTFRVNKSKQKNAGQILTVGDFYPHKSYLLLLKSFARLKKNVPHASLVIVGREVNSEVSNKIKQLINSLNIQDSVTFKGVVPHSELRQLYASSELYLSLSKAEAFNITLLEALTVGLPAVVMDYDFQHEVAGENGALYIPIYSGKSSDEKTIAAASGIMLRVFEDKSVAEFFINKGLKQAKEFSWKKTASVIANVIKTV